MATPNDPLAQPLTLPCGTVLKNRLAKAPLTEGLADGMNRATEGHVRLYQAWAQGGAGLVVTGNVQVDRRFLERPGNVVIDNNGGLEQLRAYARAGTQNGTQLFMQISHPGRQTPRRDSAHPVAPSAIKLNLPESAFAPPRALELPEIADIIRRFAHVAKTAQDTGFSGVQIHAAHGYLVSEFLSPLANQRTDRYGGPLENRARLLLDIVRAIRKEVGPKFPITAKLNSSDFQKGGFDNAECLQLVQWLEQERLDMLEISGGNYEEPSMMGSKINEAGEVAGESTVKREAYFLDYAARIRKVTRIPLMVTGGFRSRAAMEAALRSGALDIIGLGRPMCVETDLPNRLLSGQAAAGGAYEKTISPAKAGLGWFCLQLLRIGHGQAPDIKMTGGEAIERYIKNESETADRLIDRKAA
jgi:2,4-dienoyl-CoA reductase-like NADH-dependent reductase (Old Yellow Enzyme family)